jgi:tRNA pseudouridine38-40 synthase
MVALLRVALVTAYDGTPYRGWADVRDVALRPALERVLGQPIRVEAASRTDAGVHARGQVCAFDVERAGMSPDELAKLQYSLNQLLPPELSVRHTALMPSSFDPRSNLGKEYRYALSIGAGARDPLQRLYEWHVPARRGAPAWDAEAAAAAARALEGTHSFGALANTPRGSERKKVVDPVCTLSRVRLHRTGRTRLSVRLTGSRFLYKMARNSVGAIVRVGSGLCRNYTRWGRTEPPKRLIDRAKLAEALGSLRPDLALREASRAPAGRRLSPLAFGAGSGELSLEELQHALRDGAFERSRSVPLTAPAHGLVLHRVNFPPEEGPFAGAVAKVALEEEEEEEEECQDDVW